MLIKETFVNETEGHVFSKTGWYEPYTEDKEKLFRNRVAAIAESV